MRSWLEERKLQIFDSVVIVIVLATLVISLLTAAVSFFSALALPGTRVFVSLIFFSVQFHDNGYQRVG